MKRWDTRKKSIFLRLFMKFQWLHLAFVIYSSPFRLVLILKWSRLIYFAHVVVSWYEYIITIMAKHFRFSQWDTHVLLMCSYTHVLLMFSYTHVLLMCSYTHVLLMCSYTHVLLMCSYTHVLLMCSYTHVLLMCSYTHESRDAHLFPRHYLAKWKHST